MVTSNFLVGHEGVYERGIFTPTLMRLVGVETMSNNDETIFREWRMTICK